ncbi:acyl-CoA thioester hydrolase [Oceanobacillus limi]|uniref:Acyl-CoA thioester hydrolase n=1 Tax=Oceanobacillus limi TaxID=930131 RepID=A0A1I0G1H8_9BACI|nr:thioesterase family protein [Oceanobacillus limi]SET64445.1 acyl-CoA thioester hydrolase [Oceanobacillus limi]
MEIRVRVGETDALGHINNASYFIYMEETRINFLQNLGIDIESKHFAFLLASTKCDYIQQGYFGQTLNIDTSVSRIGTKSLTLLSEMYEKESGDLIARGEATLVYFDTLRQQSVEVPESFKTKLQAYC